MAYTNEDRNMDLNENELYEDEFYGSDEFGESINKDYAVDDSLEEEQTAASNDTLIDTKKSQDIEDGFGETITPSANPHIEDQLEDTNLHQAAEADYKAGVSEHHDESLIDKAKDKLQEWTSDKKDK